MDQIHVSVELVILGGGASGLAEFLRALLLKIEDYPRLAAIWKYVPALFGMLGVMLFPSVVPGTTLLVLAHGALSPVVFYAAYPLLKAALVKQVQTGLKLPMEGAPEALPATTEGEKP